MARKDGIKGNEIKLLAQLLLLPVFMLGYIGAQTGSLIIQAVIAASVGIAVAIRLYWSRIKKLFTRGKNSQAAGADAETSQDAAVETEALMSVDVDSKDTLEESLLPEAETSEPELQGAAASPADGEAEIEE